MTSLAKQLQRLALPHIQTVLGGDKRRASFLYSPEEAASKDREEFYAIGVNGLEELISIESSFAQYEDTLFSSSSQDWERAIQTKQVNEKLDATIEEFLIQLSPYILLKSAHKALEWLIYRYHIHQFNPDILIMSALPYHDSTVFCKLLQLMKPALSPPTSKWHWMLPAAEAATPVMRKTVSQHCLSNPGFLSVLCDLVPKFIKVHGSGSLHLRPVTALYTCTVLAVLSHSGGGLVTDRTVGVLVPHLVRGLRATRCPGYQAASYMILAQLCTVSKLKEEFLDSLLPLLIKKICVGMVQEALSCLAIVYHTQGITTITKKSMKQLLRVPGMVSCLSTLAASTQYPLTPFLRPLLLSIVTVELRTGDLSVSCASSDTSMEEGEGATGGGAVRYGEMLTAILQDVAIETDLADELALEMLQVLIGRREGMMDSEGAEEEWTEAARLMIGTLQHRYGSSLTGALERLHAVPGNAEIVQELTQLAALPLHYQIVAGSSTSLLLAINHADPSVRRIATTHLVSSIQSGSGADRDADFVRMALINRLQDENRDVVQAALQLQQKLADYIEPQKLAAILFRLLDNNMYKEKWQSTVRSALQVLSHPSLLSSVPALASQLLPFLLEPCPLSAQLRSSLPGGHALFPGGCRDNWQVVKGCGQKLGALDAGQFAAMVRELIERVYPMSAASRTFVLLVLCEVMSRRDNAEAHLNSVNIAQTLLSLLSDTLLNSDRREKELFVVRNELSGGGERKRGAEDTLMAGCTAAMLEGRTADTLLFWTADEMLTCLTAHGLPGERREWLSSASNDVVSCGVRLFRLLLNMACSNNALQPWWRELVEKYTKSALFAAILPVLWTGESGDALTTVGAFHAALQAWSTVTDPEDVINMLQANPYVLASLVLCLSSPHAPVRAMASMCVLHLRHVTAGTTYVHRYLLERLAKRHEEVSADPSYAAKALGHIYREEGGSKEKKQDKKSVNKTSVKEFLQLVTSPSLPDHIMAGMVALFVHVPRQVTSEAFTELSDRLLSLPSASFNSTHLSALRHILAVNINETTAATLTPDAPHMTLLTSALGSSLGGQAAAGGWVKVEAVRRIEHDMFAACSDDVKCRLVSLLLDAGASATEAEVAAAAKKQLKQIKFSGSHILHELSKSGPRGEKVAKRSKGAIQPTANLDHIQPLLEVLQGKKKIKDVQELIPALFALLARLRESDEDNSEYCQQLVLSSLQVLAAKWQPHASTTSQENVPVEVLIHCVLDANSIITQQHALMVIAAIAHLFPEHVLKNVMSLFKFVSSSSLVEQDDQYSVDVISKTVATIIPALIQAHKSRPNMSGSSLRAQIREVLQQFVFARSHMPRPRAVTLLSQVIEAVGARDYLCLLSDMLLNSAVQKYCEEKTRRKSRMDVDDEAGEIVGEAMEVIEKEFELIHAVYEQIDVSDQLHALTANLSFLSKLIAVIPQVAGQNKSAMSRVLSRAPEEVRLVVPPNDKAQTQPLLLRFQFESSRLVASFLASERFIAKVLSQEPMSPALVAEFEAFISECLAYLAHVMRLFGSGNNLAGFWKNLLAKVYEILDRVNSLLPTDVFLGVVSMLMSHSVAAVRKKALDLLIARLKTLSDPASLTEEQVTSLLNLLDELEVLSCEKSCPKDVPEPEWHVMKQYSLLSIKYLAKLLASTHTHRFKKVMKSILCVIAREAGESGSQVLGNAMLCVAELLTGLGAHAIDTLPILMPLLTNVASNNRKQLNQLDKSGEMVLLCWLTVILRLTTVLSGFLSPYLAGLLSALCCCVSSSLPLDATFSPSSTMYHVLARWKAISTQLSSVIAPRVLVPVLSSCYTEVLQLQPESVSRVMMLTEQHVSSMSREDLMAHQQQLTHMLCNAMDFRATANADREIQVSADCVERTEEACLSAVLALVVRLSESAFRPMFFTLYDWACRDVVSAGQRQHRELVFFHLCHRLSQRLKSIFNMFVGHALKTMVEAMDSCNTIKEGSGSRYSPAVSAGVLRHVLGCVYQCLLHDVDGALVTTDVFDLLMQPLLDQLENELSGEESDAEYQQRTSELVIPAICQLAVAVPDDNQLKMLHLQVCLKTQHDKPKVRFACVQLISAIAEKLGEQYYNLYPDAHTSLYERLEDEVEEVELASRAVLDKLKEIVPDTM